jgi:hypothetical protein
VLGLHRGARSFCLDRAKQLHQVLDLDAFERTYRILDFAAEPLVDAVGDQAVELFDRVVPREWMGSKAGIVLNFVLDYIPVLQTDCDLGGHLAGIDFGEFVVRPNRNLLQ